MNSMRSASYAVMFSTLFWCLGTAQAANDLDGKALMCFDPNPFAPHHQTYGLVFDKGKVTRIHVEGYSKVSLYKLAYSLRGTTEVYWVYSSTVTLNRETLKVNSYQYSDQYSDQCKISSKKEISQKLDAIIAEAKKKNKL